MDDYTLLVTQLLGVTPLQLGAVLLTLLSAAVIAGLVKPYLRAALAGIRRGLDSLTAAARRTKTRIDDHLVSGLVAVFVASVWVIDAVFWLLAVVVEIAPHFEEAIKRAREAKLLEERKPPSRAYLGTTLLLVLLAGVLVTTTQGCGPTQAQALHRGLNRATDYVDPVYELAVVSCDLAEGEVIARHQPDERAAARTALEAVRLECDRVFASFEELRALQLVARATADALEDGRATAQDLVRSLDEVMAAAAATRELVTAFRARHLTGGAS